jgi:hypothetical protein
MVFMQHQRASCSERRQSKQIWQPQRGQTGLPSVCGQRRRTNTFSAPRSDIRITLLGLSERAAADRRTEEVLRHQGRVD